MRKSSTTYEEKYGKYLWATPTVFPVYPMRLPGIVTDQEAFLYMVGRWAGDGWIRKRTDRQNLIRICCHKKESDELKAKLSETGFKWAQEGHTENVDVFTLGAAESKAIIPWLNNSFGEYAHKKTLPAWLFSADASLKKSFINGYFDADGSYNETTKLNAAVTVSRCLGVGIKLLLNSLGLKASISTTSEAKTAFIKEREISQRRAYSVSYKDNEWSKGFETDTMFWGAVREVVPCQDWVEVFDISVEDDHSFIADGQVVHNCWGPMVGKIVKSPDGYPACQVRFPEEVEVIDTRSGETQFMLSIKAFKKRLEAKDRHFFKVVRKQTCRSIPGVVRSR